MLEANKIYQGDCLELLRELSDQSVDAIITDPPYSSGGMFRCDRLGTPNAKYMKTETVIRRPDFAGDNRDQRSWTLWSIMWLKECLRVAKPHTPICLFIDWRQLPALTDALQIAGWVWRGVAVWDKTEAARPTMGRFRQQAEFIVWGSNGPMPENKDIGCLPGVFRHVVKQEDKHHVTGKPTPLMCDVIKISPPGGIVLDPFAGSGTTLLAAKEQGRQYIGFELGSEYCKIANDRLSKVPLKLTSYRGFVTLDNFAEKEPAQVV